MPSRRWRRRWASSSFTRRCPPTFASGVTARPPCSTPPVRWSPRPLTFRCISVPCMSRSRRCVRSPPARATCSSSTTPIPAARTSPTSHSSARSTSMTRRADLAAQRAAVARGAEGLRALAARYGWGAVRGAATDLLDYAERRARDALGRLTATALTATDWLEGDGVDDADLAIRVRVDITDGVFHVDFTGTSPAARGNVNCPLAVARSPALFGVRTLLPEDVPTNGGVSRAVRVTAPLGCLVNAHFPSAVAAGNVETSQRIADTVFLALAAGGIAVPAQGQGTMNNVTFGASGWTYYETIGGGQGASHGAPGPSGVHV